MQQNLQILTTQSGHGFVVAAQKAGHLARDITPVQIPQKKGDALVLHQV